jgi:hypothetical protein
MASSPTIKYASATKDASSTLIMALLENTSKGMVQMRAYLDSSCVTEDAAMRSQWCVAQMSNSYIPELYYLANNYKTTTTTATSACVRAYICNVGENCDTLACSTWNSSFNSQISTISIDSAFGNTPIAVSNLTLTPGDKQIAVSWGDAGQTTSIWAYHVALYQGATLLIDGWRVKNNMVVSNLTNGTPYKIMVMAGSFDGYSGPWTDKTATPVAPCTVPGCGFVVA